MKVKITVLTPKNKAKGTEKSLKTGIVGLSKPLETKLVAHNKFYWIVEIEEDKKKEKKLNNLVSRCAKAEVLTKKGLQWTLKTFGWANKQIAKGNRGVSKVKKMLSKRMRKAEMPEEDIEKINNMSDDEFIKHVKIEDREEIEALLLKQLITVKVVSNG